MRLFLPAFPVLLLLAACGGEPAPTASNPAPAAPVAPVAAPAPPAAPAGSFTCCADERDTKVVTDYLAVQTALAKDDDAAAVASLTELAASVALAQDEPSDAALAAILVEAQAAQGAADITARRTAVKKLSAAIIPFAKGHTGGTLAMTEAYCPMAEASWLQAGNVIANPYYGASMLTCGSFK